MANLAFVSYAVEGNEKDIRKIDNLFSRIESNGYNNEWKDGYTLKSIMLEIAKELGISLGEGLEYRGHMEGHSVKDGVVYFETECAWHNNFDFEDLLKKYAPSANIFYYCDADDGFASNDEEGKYFNSAYRIDYSLEDDADIETFQTLEAFLARFNLLMDCDCKTFEEAEDFALDYESDDYFVNVYR